MKIIERGEIPSEKVYRSRCMGCKTLVEFKAAEAKSSPDPRDQGVLCVDCPVCQRWIEALASRPYTEPVAMDRVDRRPKEFS